MKIIRGLKPGSEAAKAGLRDGDVVTYSVAMDSVQGDPTSYRCNVTDHRGKKIEGAILLDSGRIRRSTAPGMVTFYPFEPLPHGKVNVNWTWEAAGQATTLSAAFQTK